MTTNALLFSQRPVVPGYHVRAVPTMANSRAAIYKATRAGARFVFKQSRRPEGLNREVDIVHQLAPLAIGPVLQEVQRDPLDPERIQGAVFVRYETDLFELLQLAENRLRPRVRLALATRFLELLATLHGAGFVHGDLKPEKVLVNENPLEMVLCDFETAHPFAVEGPPGGSGGFLAPEVGDPPFTTESSDIYAAGIVVMEVLLSNSYGHCWFFPRELPLERLRTTSGNAGCLQLIARLSATEPGDRCTLAEALGIMRLGCEWERHSGS